MTILEHLAHVVVRINDLVIHYLAILLYRHDIRIHETAIRLETESSITGQNLLVKFRIHIDSILHDKILASLVITL